MEKERLDIEIFKRKLVESRRIATDLVLSGKVLVNGKIISKPNQKVSSEERIEITEMPKYVSRAGEKLEGAMEDFNFNPNDLVVLDAGSSTGGFTDYLLQNGVKKVYAVDVGENQLREKIKEDSRVISMEKTDIRNLVLPEKVDLVVADISFMSIKLALSKFFEVLKDTGNAILLIKPQFEVGKEKIGKGGIVRDEKIQKEAVEDVKIFAKNLGFDILGETKSKVVGQDGNQEYFLHIKK